MESVLRGLAVYLFLLVITRLSGRRTLAQITPFDFVLLLIVAETTQQALLGDDFSITNAAVLILTLFGLDIILAHLKQKSPRAARLLDGAPTVLISQGIPVQKALEGTRVSLDEIMESARAQHGIARFDQIEHAVLEVDGEISIIPRSK
jgi:uncharacterized membrane protein YcaP (DUF421 family)